MKPRLFGLFLCTCVLALGVLWIKTQGLDGTEHDRLNAVLRELRRLDRTLNQDILRARFQLINTYDPLVATSTRMDVLVGRLALAPERFDAESLRSWQGAKDHYTRALREKRELVETFKSRNSILKNSLRYLPLLGTQLTKRAEAVAATGQLAPAVRDLLQTTLIYNLTSDETLRPDIQAKLSAFSLLTRSAAIPPELAATNRTFELHIRAILRVKPEVDALIKGIFDAPVPRHEEQIAAAFQAGYSKAEAEVSAYRLVLYATCVVLLGAVVYGVQRLRRAASALSEANAQLEKKVLERTSELAAKNRDMRAVLDNVNQALFTVDLQGNISPERSLAFDHWFESSPSEASLSKVFGDGPEAGYLELGWESLREDCMPVHVVLEQLPKQFEQGSRHYSVEYRPVVDGERLEKILLVISDVTHAREGDRIAAEQREVLAVFEHLIRDRRAFLAFHTEAEDLVARIVEGRGSLRDLHTLKGNTGLFGVTSVAALCHELESECVATGVTLSEDAKSSLQTSWQRFEERIRRWLDSESDERIEITGGEYRALTDSIASGAPPARLLLELRRLQLEPAQRRLSLLSEQARALARRMGKEDIEIVAEANHVRLDARRWAPFWAAFVHLVRNALDHGIESAEERRLSGKSERGRIALRIEQSNDCVQVEVHDDGRGIDWDAVSQRAAELHLPCANETDLFRALLHQGLSTKATVTEVSGRGVGMSALSEACATLGGEIHIISHKGQGTTVRIRVPLEDELHCSVVAA